MGVIHVSCGVERNYISHSAAMLASVLRNRGDNAVEIHYLHGPRFPRRGRQRLEEMVGRLDGSISFVEIPDSAVAGMPTRGFTRKATWYRIFLSELLPTVERALWLDVDTLATSDLDPLWRTELGDHYLGAVTNVFMTYHVHRADEFEIDPRSYFNAGVLLMNLELMRRDDCAERLRSFAVDNAGRLAWRDQDTLNLVLGERRLHLHPRWNCMLSILRFSSAVDVFGAKAVDEARRNPGIRHFEGPGPNKPWHVDSEPADRRLYLESRRETPWPRVRLEGNRPRDRLARIGEGLRPRGARLYRALRRILRLSDSPGV